MSRKLLALIVLLFLIIAVLAGVLIHAQKRSLPGGPLMPGRTTDKKSGSPDASDRESRTTVSALGRLEPEGEVIEVNAAEVDRLERLTVQEGETVESGAVLGYLERHAVRLAEKNQAASQLEEAKKRYEAEKAYGEALVKEAELALQRAEEILPVEVRIEELGILQKEELLLQDLKAQEVRVTQLQAQLAAETALHRAQIREAELRVQEVESLFPINVQAQEAVLRQFQAEYAHAKSDLERLDKLTQGKTITDEEVQRKSSLMNQSLERMKNAEAVLARIKSAHAIDTVAASAQLETAKARLQSTESQIVIQLQAAIADLEKLRRRLAMETLGRRPRPGSDAAGSEKPSPDPFADLNNALLLVEKLKKSTLVEQELARAKLAAARSNLARTLNNIPIDSLEKSLQLAQARLEWSILKAPSAGEILKIFIRPGEQTGSSPILKMGNTRQMYAVAEVYETDIGLVRKGQPASVSSPALRQPIDGEVEHIGRMIFKNDVLSVDPAADTDARVIEVRIKLRDSFSAASLTNLQVDVRIQVGPGSTARGGSGYVPPVSDAVARFTSP
ncbi:MAG: HlyD family efflux transporter periplasmic adaptor subunit [Planctomycetes bacterium]|nr:HlyD family efflux transporter periplasmic adaptor subunit [Planctomycetota bacterium]